MSRSIPQINTTDTFQVWLQRSNDVINELETTVLTASTIGDTTVGNATLIGSFTANNVSVSSLVRTNTIDTKVGNTSPISILGAVDFTSTSPVPITIKNSSGPRISVENNNIAWQVGLRGSSGTGTNAEFIIGVEGSDFALRIGADGVVRANTIILTSDSSSTSSAVRSSRAIATNDGITGGGDFTADRTLGLTGNALSLHQLATTGIVARTATNTLTSRTISNGAGITVTDGNGVSGNPTIGVDSTVVRTTGDVSISGVKQFTSGILVGSSTSSQVSYGDVDIACSPSNSANDSMRINYTSPSNSFFRTLNVYNGKQQLIAAFDGPTSSLLVGASTDSSTQIVNNQITASPNSSSLRSLDLNYTTTNNAFRNVDIYDGKEVRFARFTGSSKTLDVSGNITAFSTSISSDIRLKSNVSTIDNALQKVLELRGVRFDMMGKTQIGVIAQEVETVVPEVVDSTNEYKTVAYANLVGLLIEAVKELSQQVEQLKAKS